MTSLMTLDPVLGVGRGAARHGLLWDWRLSLGLSLEADQENKNAAC